MEAGQQRDICCVEASSCLDVVKVVGAGENAAKGKDCLKATTKRQMEKEKEKSNDCLTLLVNATQCTAKRVTKQEVVQLQHARLLVDASVRECPRRMWLFLC